MNHNIKANDSVTWKGIIRCMNLKAFIRWRSGKGSKISFWFDNGLGNMHLCEVMSNIDEANLDIKLEDVIDEEGNWSLEVLNTEIQFGWKGKIMGKNPRLNDNEDRLIWSKSTNGIFSCQSAYKSIRRTNTEDMSATQNLKWIWNAPCSNKKLHDSTFYLSCKPK